MTEAELEINGEGQYIIDELPHDRVTHIIGAMLEKPWLDAWRKRVGYEEAERIGEKTAYEGELIHLITLLSDKKDRKGIDRLLNSHSWLLPHMLAWNEMVRELKVRWISRERVYFNKKLRIAGRLDGVGYIESNPLPTIFDIKSGSLYDEIGIQVWGAYRELYNLSALRKKRAGYALVVQLPRDRPGEWHTRDYTKDRYIQKWNEIRDGYIKLYR